MEASLFADAKSSLHPSHAGTVAHPQSITRPELANLIDLLPDAALVIDASGTILLANDFVRDLLGFEATSLPGHPLSLLIPPRYRDGHGAHISAFFRHARKMAMSDRPVVLALGSGGEEIPVSISLAGLVLDGEPAAMAVMRDASNFHRRLSDAIARSEFDPLTGIGNRTLFGRRLKAMLSDAEPFAVLYIDLRKFKAFNDRFGHHVGDEVLRVVARRLSQSIRTHDVASRLGGDEFAVLIQGMQRGALLAARIETIAAQLLRPLEIEGVSGAIGANIGVAVFPDDGRDEQALVRHADANMYQAKSRGLTHWL